MVEYFHIGDQLSILQCDVNYLAQFAKYVGSLETKSEEKLINLDELGPVYPSVSNPEQVSEWERILYQALYKACIREVVS
mgnify:CR=1 FL=1